MHREKISGRLKIMHTSIFLCKCIFGFTGRGCKPKVTWGWLENQLRWEEGSEPKEFLEPCQETGSRACPECGVGPQEAFEQEPSWFSFLFGAISPAGTWRKHLREPRWIAGHWVTSYCNHPKENRRCPNGVVALGLERRTQIH